MSEKRIRYLPSRFTGGAWQRERQEIIRLGDVGKWAVCRPVDYPQACPFCMSRKEWDRLEIAG